MAATRTSLDRARRAVRWSAAFGLLLAVAGGALAEEETVAEPDSPQAEPGDEPGWGGFIRLRGIPIPVGAHGQLTLLGARVDLEEGGLYRAELAYDWFIDSMQLGFGLTYVDSNLPSLGGRGIGNTRMSFSYLYERPVHRRGTPFGVALLLDVYAPTGNLGRGTGGGGWLTELGVVAGFQPVSGLQVLPAIRYVDSFGEGRGDQQRFVNLEGGIMWEPPRLLSWVLYLPRLLYDVDAGESAFAHTLQVGRMLTPRIGVFADYSWTGRTRTPPGGFDEALQVGILYAW